jgi:hypothetical protein
MNNKPIIKLLILLVVYSSIFTVSRSFANENSDSLYQNYYRSAYDEISNMAHEKPNLNFENAIFALENAYYANKLSKKEYVQNLDFHTQRILSLANANKKRIDSIEEKTPFGILTQSKEEQIKLNNKVLLNWAIYTYITDTTWWKTGDAYLPRWLGCAVDAGLDFV